MRKILLLCAALFCLCACDKEGGSDSVTAIYLNKGTLNLGVGVSETLIATLEPEDAQVTVKWKSLNADIAKVESGKVTGLKTGTTTIVASAGKVSATCEVNVSAGLPEGAVDLGLSVYWASCNVGAKQPPESGMYFSWGETETKGNYLLQYYKWGDGSDINGSQHMTKYNATDGKTELDAEDDAARVILGGRWRTPTRAEMDELVNKCTWTKTSRRIEIGFGVYYDEDIWGFEVTGPNGNSIFIPSAGYRLDRYYYGEHCFLYTATRVPDRPDFAYRLDANSTYHWTEGYYREFGYPIRPVCD